MKALKISGAIVGLVVLVLVVASGVMLAVGIPGSLFVGTIEERVEKETGYKLDINGGMTIRLLPKTVVTLSDVAVFDPKDTIVSERFRAETIRTELSLRSLLGKSPRVHEVKIDRPTITVPMSRERMRTQSRSPSTANLDDLPMNVERIVLSDATLVLRDPRHRMENRIERVNVTAVVSDDRNVDVNIDQRSGSETFRLEARSRIPTGPVDGMTLPVEFKIDAPGVLPQAVSGRSQIKVAGTTATVSNLSGAYGNANFSGYATIEATAKPLVKVNLDFKQLGIDKAGSFDAKSAASQGWSDQPIKLDGLNYVDAEFNVSAAVLSIGKLQLAPAKVAGTLESGIVRMTVSEVGLYRGLAGIGLALDASGATPALAMRAELMDVRALPLFTAAADFTKLDGRMWAKLDIRTSGNSERQMVANLSGTTTFDFRDGQIIGVNVAQMIRNLTTTTLSGWQENDAQQGTDLSELHASFSIANGRAEVRDLRVAGPLIRVTGAGTTDITNKTLAFRLEPKLVMTLQGQGSNVANPVGLGVPVVMEGSWASPRIYPDMAGILENPEGAFAKLRELGQGLFGPNFFGGQGGQSGLGSLGGGQGGQPGTGNKLIEGIGSIIQGLNKPQGTTPQSQGQAPQSTQPGQQPQAQSPPTPQTPQSQQIDNVIRQLFGK